MMSCRTQGHSGGKEGMGVEFCHSVSHTRWRTRTSNTAMLAPNTRTALTTAFGRAFAAPIPFEAEWGSMRLARAVRMFLEHLMDEVYGTGNGLDALRDLYAQRYAPLFGGAGTGSCLASLCGTDTDGSEEPATSHDLALERLLMEQRREEGVIARIANHFKTGDAHAEAGVSEIILHNYVENILSLVGANRMADYFRCCFS